MTEGDSTTAVLAALADGPEIDRVIHLRMLYLGPDELLVAAKVAIGGEDSGTQIAAAVDAAEVRVRAVVPEARLIFIEPDIDVSSVDHQR